MYNRLWAAIKQTLSPLGYKTGLAIISPTALCLLNPWQGPFIWRIVMETKLSRLIIKSLYRSPRIDSFQTVETQVNAFSPSYVFVSLFILGAHTQDTLKQS